MCEGKYYFEWLIGSGVCPCSRRASCNVVPFNWNAAFFIVRYEHNLELQPATCHVQKARQWFIRFGWIPSPRSTWQVGSNGSSSSILALGRHSIYGRWNLSYLDDLPSNLFIGGDASDRRRLEECAIHLRIVLVPSKGWFLIVVAIHTLASGIMLVALCQAWRIHWEIHHIQERQIPGSYLAQIGYSCIYEDV